MLPGRVPSEFGPITVDVTSNDGSGTLHLSNLGIANTNLILQFCPYPQDFAGCVNIAPLATDADGKADITFTFPQKGAYSGIFALMDTNSSLVGATSTGSSGISFQSALLPAATITGGIQQTTGLAPGSGTIVINGTTAHITLVGTTANHTFDMAVCSLVLVSPCQPLASITTDADGNASADVGDVQAAGWSNFRVSDSDGVEFMSAFRVK